MTENTIMVAAPTQQCSLNNNPLCYLCGIPMQRAGSCLVCSACGETSGCS